MISRLRALTLADVEHVRLWREDDATRAGLRRPDPLTQERQAQWYHDNVCRPDSSRDRYWAVEIDGAFVGHVSLESIEPHVKAEIGLITNPELRGKGYGREALRLLLAKGFDEMGLRRVFGVCYTSNVALGFWRHELKRYDGFEMGDDDWTETNTWGGVEHPSRRFWFSAERWRERRAA